MNETKIASLETFSVTIQALHVSGKQMTLAVFRQLPVTHEDARDQTWGIVRYSIGYEGNLWLVFSSNGRLYRREIITRRPTTIAPRIKHELGRERKKMDEWSYQNGPSKEKIDARILELEADLKQEEENYEDAIIYVEYNEKLLATLPQLFIAV